MNKLDIINKENNSIFYNQNLKKNNFLEEKKGNIYLQTILSELKSSDAYHKSKKLIDNIITTLKNNTYLILLKEAKPILLHIYKLLQKTILDNNRHIIFQLSLIDLFIDNLNKDKTFILFFKRILPKLFDKFYLHNENINSIMLSLLNKSIEKNLLTISDYYSYIEAITLEDDNNYILNVLKFFYFQIKKDDYNFDIIPKNIINIIKQKYDEIKKDTNNNKDNNSYNTKISEICENILLILNNQRIKNNNEDSLSNNLGKNDSFLKEKEGKKENDQDLNRTNNTIFQKLIIKTNNNNEKNKNNNSLNTSNKEIIYLEGNNSLIESIHNKKKINKSTMKLYKEEKEKDINDNKFENYSNSTIILTNFGVSTIDPPQDFSDVEDEQLLFNMSNQNVDKFNEEIFQKTPFFKNFNGSGNFINKNIKNSSGGIEPIKPII